MSTATRCEASGKIPFWKREHAFGVANRRGQSENKRLYVYECPSCALLHLTRSPRWSRVPKDWQPPKTARRISNSIGDLFPDLAPMAVDENADWARNLARRTIYSEIHPRYLTSGRGLGKKIALFNAIVAHDPTVTRLAFERPVHVRLPRWRRWFSR